MLASLYFGEVNEALEDGRFLDEADIENTILKIGFRGDIEATSKSASIGDGDHENRH